MYAEPDATFWFLDVSKARMIDAGGIGATVIGGGLAVGGIIRMIVKK